MIEATVEGIDDSAKMTMSEIEYAAVDDATEIALYHVFDAIPEARLGHGFY